MPQGYLFVPKGDVYVTRNWQVVFLGNNRNVLLSEYSRKLTESAGQVLYVVYDDVSHKQLGLRCPAKVHNEVKSMALASASKRHEVACIKDEKDIDKAGKTIRKLFPKIPSGNCRAVLEHSFMKGSGRVGRSTTLDDDKKVTLAVVAHIRHTMTPYEAILRQLTQQGVNEADCRLTARAAIADRIAEVLQLWRRKSSADPTTRRVPLTRTSQVKVAFKSKSAPRHKTVLEASAKAVTTRQGIHKNPRPRHIKRRFKNRTIIRK